MKKPTISVIMPVYNTVPEYLRTAIDSILSQTFTDFEFIIINDGSTDERVEKTIKSYKDRRIRYIRKENSGITKTLLRGLRLARGEFIARMDSDDISVPDRMAVQVEFLRAHPEIGLVGGWLQTISGGDIWRYPARPTILNMYKGCAVGHPVVMWRRAEFEKYGLEYNPQFPFAQDYELWSRAIRFVKFANIQTVLLKYRVGTTNVSHTHHEHQLAIDRHVKKNIIEFLSTDPAIQAKIREILTGDPNPPAEIPLPAPAPTLPDARPLAPWVGRIICCMIPSRWARHAFRARYVRRKTESQSSANNKKMKMFQKTQKGKRIHIYFCGIKIASYKNRSNEKFQRLYARRFDPNLSKRIRTYIIQHQFQSRTGYKFNPRHPKTFNEKMQWLKLNYEDPMMTVCADKVAVRDYITEKIGKEYLVPCLGTWANPDDIDFDKLPNKFVLKVNWGSGQNIIVKDKSTLDTDRTRAQLREWMRPKNNLYYTSFEWVYKNIKPMIIAEQFIEGMDDDLLDYKFMCFNGEPKMLFVCSNRTRGLCVDFFDLGWNHLPFIRHFKNNPKPIEKPKHLEQMIKLAKILCASFPFVRVDIYEHNDRLYIGELTFYPGNGMEPFTPFEWDRKLGDLLVLPK